MTKNKNQQFIILLIFLSPINLLFAEDLVTVYSLALNKDINVRLSNINRLFTLESVRQNKAAYFPQISLQGTYNQLSTSSKIKFLTSDPNNPPNQIVQVFEGSDEYSNTNYNLSVSQIIYNKRLFSNTKIVNSNYQLSKLQQKNSQIQLTYRVIAAYFEILAAADEIAFRQEEKFSMYDLLTKTYEKNKAGLSSRIDVNDIQAQYDTTVANHSLALFRQSTAYETLKIITGKLYSKLQPLADDSPIKMPEPANVKIWIKNSLENNLNLKIFRSNVSISQQSIALQRSDRFPQLSLIGNYNTYDDFSRPTSGRVLNTTQFSLQLDWKIFQGGASNSRIQQAELFKSQQQILLKQQMFIVERTARDMYYLASSGLTRVQDLYRAVLSHQSALQSNRAGYDVGERSITNLLDAHRRLFQSKRDYVQEKYNHILNMASLRLNTGKLGLKEIKRINQWLQQ